MNTTDEYISGSKLELIHEIKTTIKDLKQTGYNDDELSDYKELLDDLQAIEDNAIYVIDDNNGMGYTVEKITNAKD